MLSASLLVKAAILQEPADPKTQTGKENTNMLRRRLCFFHVSIWMLLVCSCVLNPAFGRGLDKRVVGTYFLDVSFEEPGRQFPALIELSRDGGVTTAQGNKDFGVDISTFFGSWQSIGYHLARIVFLGFVYGEDGTHLVTAKVTIIAEFDEDFASFEGENIAEYYSPLQDPLDPGEIPLPAGTGEVIGRRITAD